MQNKTFKFLLLILFILICWLLGRYIKLDIDYYRNIFSQYPIVLSGFIYVFLYVLTTTFIWFGPKDVFRVSGAVIFGAWISTTLVLISEVFNAGILFFISRKLGREFVEQKFKIKEDQLDKIKKDKSFWGVLALRINPIIPFRLMDLGFGLSDMSLRRYIIVIAVASPVRIYWLQHILSIVGEAIIKPKELINHINNDPFILKFSSLYFLTVIVITIIAVVNRFLKKKRTNNE